jgi:tetratricopeptide (TPR) repeat protein
VALEHRQKRIRLIIYLGLIAATFAAYEPMWHNGFVHYDDYDYVMENPNVNGGITKQSVIWAFTTFHAANWHPLTWLSHMLDCQLFGPNPFWHHLINLLFHIANALLLFWILNSLTGTLWPSAFVAAVFALHPVQVESVAWVAERKTVMSGLFWFLTTAVYIWYTKRPGIGRYALLFVVYALCIMTKPIVVTLPLVLLLLDYWPLGRLNWGSSPAGKTAPAGRLLIEKVPLLVLSAILSVTTFIAQQREGRVISIEVIPLDFRIANAFISYIRYIGKMIFPSRLAVFYPHPQANLSNTAVAVCALLFVLISILSIYTGRHRKYAAVGWLWYVGTLVPMVGLVQVSSQAMADRYMYISMLGLLIIAAWAVKDLIANGRRRSVVAAALAMVVLPTMVILTRMQVRHWQNDIQLFGHTLEVTENNASAEYDYGWALLDEGRDGEAVQHLRKAVQINPSASMARKDLGKVLLKQGKLNEAIECFNELTKCKQDSAEAYYYLAVASGMQKKYDDAIKYLTSVLKLDPKYPDAHYKMGIALLAMGKPNEAVVYLNEALRIDANQPDVYIDLGTAYSQLDKYEPAIQNWTKAAELKPNSAEVLNNLAWLLATAGDVSAQDADRTIELAQRACELTGYKEPVPLDTLAAAYAAAGRFDDAVTTANKAVDAAKAMGRESIVGEIQERIELYQTGQRYRQK